MKRNFRIIGALALSAMLAVTGCSGNQKTTAKAKSTTSPVVTETATEQAAQSDKAAGKVSKNDRKGTIQDITSQELLDEMTLGWNLGDSLDVCAADRDGDGQVDEVPEDGKVDETLWGNVETKKEIFETLKAQGINAVRIPVTWRDHMGAAPDYTIDEEWMNRVQEVVNYAYDLDMYVIINVHHDGGGDPAFGAWIRNASTDKEKVIARYKAVWEQIANRFQNYSDHLIFESMNEVGFDDLEEADAYQLLNEMNQTFVDLVRSSGGNNAKRHLLIAGYWTDIAACTNENFQMPKDEQNRCILSVHYYTPWQFCTTNQQNTWGSDAEVEEMAGKIALLKEYFTDKKIPVLVGEFGTGLDNDTKSRIKFCKELTRRCKKIGIPVFFWDNGGEFDRENLTWRTKGLAEAMLKAATKEKLVVYVAAEGKNDSGATVSIDKTPVLVEEGTMASDAVKTVLDSAYPDDYVMKQETWGDFLQSIGKLDTPSDYSYSWNFCVNGEMASVGISSYELQAQDQISLIYGGYPLENTECSVYADDEMLSPDAEAQKALLDNAEAQQKVLAEKIYEAQFESGKRIPGIEDASGLYSVFSLAQSNFDADAFYDAVYEKISKQLEGIQKYGKFYDETLGKEITEKSIKTDRSLGKNAVSQYYAKIALCVLALGKNPADVGGVNLYQKMLERSAYDASSVYSRESMILFVLDAKVCELPEGENYVTKGELVNNLLADVDNQIATAISWTSYDSAAMAIQALAPYLTETVDGVSKEEVENACQKVLHLLSVMQNGTGGYPGYGTDNNAWSLAQAMTTMGCFGISALEETETEAGFINNGKTVFDAASAFVDSSKQTVSEELMGFQPEQLLRGLNACIRTALGEETIYQTENVAYPANESDKIVLSPEMISAIPAQTYEGKACEPAVVVTCDGKVLKAGTDYTVSYIDNDKEGTAYAIVTGTGDYVLSQQVAFQIVKKAVVNQNNTNNNGNKNQSITKKESTKKKTLKKPVIKKVTSPKKKTLKVTFKKVSGAKKYVVEISTNKKFKKSVKKKTVKKTTVTFSKLKAKKKYYVRVRAYNGNVKSGYSTVKSKKIK